MEYYPYLSTVDEVLGGMLREIKSDINK